LQAAIDRLLPTFPQAVQDAWAATRQIKVIETPAGSLPVAVPPPNAEDPVGAPVASEP